MREEYKKWSFDKKKTSIKNGEDKNECLGMLLIVIWI